MRDPCEWTEADLQQMIDNKIQENLYLDYKRSDALGKTDHCRNELSKDIAAFANSAGGRVIYGIAEGKDNYPERIDDGVDSIVLNREWLEQTITSNIQPRIDGLRIYPIALPSKGENRVVYVVDIPQSMSRAPHQSRDFRYYKRYEFQSVPMEDYEIRDVFRRASSPDLWIKFSFDSGESTRISFQSGSEISDPIRLHGHIGNHSATPAEYAVIMIYLDDFFAPVFWAELEPQRRITHQGRDFKGYRLIWGVPHRLLSSPRRTYPLPRLLNFTVTSRMVHEVREFYLGATPSVHRAALWRSSFVSCNSRQERW